MRTTTRSSRPGFIADPASITRMPGGRQIDWPSVPDSYRTGAFQIVVSVAGAALGAVSVPIAASPGFIPAGTVLKFTGVDEFAKTTADVAEGATAVPVEALVSALESGDAATVAAPESATQPGAGGKHLIAGTVLCELASGKCVPRGARPGAETAIGILETPANEISASDALSGYGVIVGGVVYENLLPDAVGGPPKVLPTAYKTEMQTAGVGTGFAFQVYADNRS